MASKRAGLIVLGSPRWKTWPPIDRNRTVDDDTCRRIAVVERSSVDEGLESRAWLAQRLDGTIELALGEAEATDEGEHSASVGIQGDQRAADRRNLLQRPLARGIVLIVFGFPRRYIDHVARLEHIGRAAGRCAHANLEGRTRPLHLAEWDLALLGLFLNSTG